MIIDAALCLANLNCHWDVDKRGCEPGPLKAEDTSDILAFILQSNGFPAGTAPLAAGEGLKSVNFDVAKPVPQAMPAAKRPR